MRQLLDLLRQLADSAIVPGTAETARAAVDAVQRGVVAASSAIAITPAPPVDLQRGGHSPVDTPGIVTDPPA